MPPAMPGGTRQATLKEAAEHLRRGDVNDAETLARAALAEHPGQPEALRILARCAYERGSARDGLALALEAARSMQSQRVDPANEYLIWSDLGFMFGVALVGIDSALAADRRVAYARTSCKSRCRTRFRDGIDCRHHHRIRRAPRAIPSIPWPRRPAPTSN